MTYRWAFTSRCPYCGLVEVLTPDANEASEAQRLQVPDPAVYSEPVPMGAGVHIHFVSCRNCHTRYVCRRGPRAADLQKVKNWELRMSSRTEAAAYVDDARVRTQARKAEESNPQNAPPKVHLDWQGVTFDTWMREVLATSNMFLRQKAIREAENRGIILPWDAVAASM